MASNSFLFQPRRKPNVLDGVNNQGQFEAQQITQTAPPRQPTLQDFSVPGTQEGKVISPLTGKKKNQPGAYADALAVLGPQEAMNFRFDNLPNARTGEIVQGLLGSANQAGQDRASALKEVQDLQARALAPNLDAETRAFFQQMADERRAAVESEFAQGGGISNQFERQSAANLAGLANRGVIDSTTGSQALARQNVDLASLRQQLLNQAAEQSRQDLLTERTGIRDTATQFGGLQGNLANAAGQLQQSGLGTAGQIGLQGRQLESELQLAELGQRLLGSQTALQNIQSLRNQRLSRQQSKELADLQRQLIEDQLNHGLFGGITKDLYGISPTQAVQVATSLGGRG